MNPNIHLTPQQFCDLLIADPSETTPELEQLREHLLHCPECTEEVASLHQPLEDFRSSVTAWASRNAASRSWMPPARPNPFSSLSGWMLVAAALLLLAILPIASHHRKSPSIAAHGSTGTSATSANTQSSTLGDEALLEEINQTVSSSIPTPMQPLADPTANHSQIDSTPRKN